MQATGAVPTNTARPPFAGPVLGDRMLPVGLPCPSPPPNQPMICLFERVPEAVPTVARPAHAGEPGPWPEAPARRRLKRCFWVGHSRRKACTVRMVALWRTRGNCASQAWHRSPCRRPHPNREAHRREDVHRANDAWTERRHSVASMPEGPERGSVRSCAIDPRFWMISLVYLRLDAPGGRQVSGFATRIDLTLKPHGLGFRIPGGGSLEALHPC